VDDTLIEKLRRINGIQMPTLEGYLDYYRKTLPARCPTGIGEELGPVFQQNRNDLADKYLRRIFCLGDTCVDLSGNLNWMTAAHGDLEWTCTLARHHHLPVLAEAYEKTGSECFAQETITQMLHWIDNTPRPSYPDKVLRQYIGDKYLKVKQSNWRPLEVGFRIGETWPQALSILISSRNMLPEKWARIMLSAYDQAAYLSKYRWTIGNHSILEAAMLSVFCILFREFKDTETWLKECVGYLLDSRDRMFYADGYSREMSGGYRWVMVKGYLTLYQVALQNKTADILPSDFAAWIHKIAKAELYHLKPDFSVPVTNESNTGARRESQLRRVHNIFNDPEIQYVLSNGKSGKCPKDTSWFYHDAKIGIMRSGWTSDSLYLSMDMGQKGGHTIGDQLSVDVSAYGRPFLSNCGRWRYTTSPNDVGWMDWAQYFKSSAACNTIIPAGFTQILADAHGSMQINKDRDYAEGTFDGGYSDGKNTLELVHKRQIFFLKPLFWILRDTVTGKGKYPVEQTWHFLADEKVVTLDSNYCAITQNEDANLVIITVPENNSTMSTYLGSNNPMRGWQCPEYSRQIPAYELVVSQYKTLPCCFDTLIFPIKGKIEEIPVFEKRRNHYNVRYRGMEWRISVDWADWRLISR